MDKSKRSLARMLGVAGGSALAWKKPVVDSLVLPVHAQISPDCLLINTAGSLYAKSVDFTNGNYLPCGSTIFSDANCVNELSTTGNAHVYAPSGQQEASQLCSSSGGLGTNGGLRAPDVYACDGCDEV